MSVPFPLPHVVLTDIRASNPREVLRRMAEALELSEAVPADMMTEALAAAEKAGGSAIGDGVAVVALRVSPEISRKRLCAFARLARPVPFRGVENHPCDMVFVMATPDDQSQAHLRDLSVIIRALRDADLTRRLRDEMVHERIFNLFRARDIALRAAA